MPSGYLSKFSHFAFHIFLFPFLTVYPKKYILPPEKSKSGQACFFLFFSLFFFGWNPKSGEKNALICDFSFLPLSLSIYLLWHNSHLAFLFPCEIAKNRCWKFAVLLGLCRTISSHKIFNKGVHNKQTPNCAFVEILVRKLPGVLYTARTSELLWMQSHQTKQGTATLNSASAHRIPEGGKTPTGVYKVTRGQVIVCWKSSLQIKQIYQTNFSLKKKTKQKQITELGFRVQSFCIKQTVNWASNQCELGIIT